MSPGASDIVYTVSPPVTGAALNALFAAGWPSHTDADFQRLLQVSLVYVCAYADARLVGFVKVIGDGGIHGFLLDTTVHPDFRRRGVGVRLVQEAVAASKVRGVEWLHVDYEPHLDTFYRACGFSHTLAGLLRLTD